MRKRSLRATLRRYACRWAATFFPRRADAAMAEEMRHHLELQAEAYVQDGMEPGAAAERARREFGRLDGLQEQCRDERGIPWLAELAQDLRYAVRILSRSRGFALVTLLTLGLGIGVNTGIFSLTDQILLRQLPVRDPAHLILFRWASPHDFPVSINGSFEPDPGTELTTCSSFPTTVFAQFQRAGAPLEGVAAFCGLDRLTVGIEGKAEPIAQAELVSGDYFGLLGVTPEIGRVIERPDDRPGAPAVVMISDKYWRRRFGGDPAAIGKPITVNGLAATIVGVCAPRFSGTLEVGDHPDLYLPLATSGKMGGRGIGDSGNAETLWWLQILGRPQAGVAPAQVVAALEGALRQEAEASLRASAAGVPPDQGRDLILIASAGGQGLTEIRGLYRRQLGLLIALGGSILALACANLANLLLARGQARQREIGVRLAMGAGRGRIVRQLFTESALLACLGGGLAVPCAIWTERALVAMQPQMEGHSLDLDATLDSRVFAIAVLIAAVTALAFGLVPALRASAVNVAAEFQGGTAERFGSPGSRLGKALLITQIAVSLVLLVCAGLLARTLRNLEHVEVGFDRRNLVLFELDPNPSGADFDRAEKINREVVARLRSLPGVQAATFSKISLLSGMGWSAMLRAQVGSTAPAAFRPTMMNAIGPGFFATYGIPLLRGREFDRRDQGGHPVAIINQTLARTCFGAADPVGRYLEQESSPGQFFAIEIVGVAADASYDQLRSGPTPTAFFPFGSAESHASARATFAVRTNENPAATLPFLRQAIQANHPLLPLINLRSQAAQIEDQSAAERMFARLSMVFSLLGLSLVALGLYGLISYSVLRRTPEIGLRMALGATPGAMVAMVLREFLLVVAVGIALGLGAWLALNRLITSLLFGLGGEDPLTLGAGILLLFAIALGSGWWPARRASRCDPVDALRRD